MNKSDAWITLSPRLERLGRVAVEVDGPEGERLLHLNTLHGGRVIVDDVGGDTRRRRAQLHHAVQRHRHAVVRRR